MLEIEVAVPPEADPQQVQRVVETCGAAQGLHTSLVGTLARYPGSVHWHFRKGTQPGTLEITFWSVHGRLWFKVHPGRKAGWIERTLPRLKRAIETALAANRRKESMRKIG